MAHVKRVDDPRLFRGQAERAGKSIRTAIVSSPIWICFLAFMTSNAVGFLGAVPPLNSLAAVAAVFVASLITRLELAALHKNPGLPSQPESAGRFDRLLILSAFLSLVWGLAAWLLWDPNSATNHVFVVLICLAIVERFLVVRGNYTTFFIASFAPMALLLMARCVIDFNSVDMVLAAIAPLYALQTVLDCNRISLRWDQEMIMRFAHEDMSRELEEARDEAMMKRAEAEHANASKTTFLANMSHELRTPLNAILGFSEIIARECLGPVGSARYKEYAADIHNSGTHLLSLINDLLDVAKIEAGRMEIEPHMIETKRMLENALKFVGAKARERDQILTVDVADDAAILYADERALKQIVINLVSNSVKFTHQRGQIEVLARRNAGNEFELVVADNGPGIPREKIDRIFKPFAQVDNRYDRQSGGTGLGLALVRGLAELHGGRAWIESDEGRGTRVFVALPALAAQESQKRRIPA